MVCSAKVGQVGNLRRVGNPPGGVQTRPSAGCQPARRMPSCPTCIAALLLLSAPLAFAGSLLDAVKAGNREAVRTLAKNRTEVNSAEPDGTTPLDWAVRA